MPDHRFSVSLTETRCTPHPQPTLPTALDRQLQQLSRTILVDSGLRHRVAHEPIARLSQTGIGAKISRRSTTVASQGRKPGP